MAVLTAPGVYVDEVSSGVRPITAASTSTAAFFGVAQRGPVGELRRIFNFTEFQNLYGAFLESHFLAHSVLSFFRNGGAQAYIGRVAVGAATASITIQDRSGTPGIRFSATSAGAWGNTLRIFINSQAATDPNNLFNVTVYQDNPKPGEDPIELESFVDLSMDAQEPNYVVTVINGTSLFIRAEVLSTGSAIQGYSESGAIEIDGDPLLGPTQRIFRININNDGIRPVDLTAELEGVDLTQLETIGEAMQSAIGDLPVLRESTPEDSYSVTVDPVDDAEGGRHLRIRAGGAANPSSKVEVYNAVDPTQDAAGALQFGPLDRVNVFGSSNMRPQDTPEDDYYFVGDDSVDGPVSAVTLGSDGDEPQTTHYEQAFGLLDTVRDVSLIAVPGIGDPALADAGMAYSRNRPLSDCFFIADMEDTDDELTEALTYRDLINVPNSYGAVYFPWLMMLDPTGASAEPISVPPSGFVAGIYARIDGSRGVWKAPAGTEALVNGAVGVVADLRDVEHGLLNNVNKSVAVIRRFPSAGLVLWGARTQSNAPEYRYIPVRRTAIMLRKSIYEGIQWAVFEPNDEPLWAALRLNIGSFMMTLFRQGAFQGSTPSQAFFVKCDSETTTQADIDNGIVNVLVGFAPLKPAEFVVVKISQIAGQSS